MLMVGDGQKKAGCGLFSQGVSVDRPHRGRTVFEPETRGGFRCLGPEPAEHQDSSHGGTCQPLLDVMDVMDWSHGVLSSPQETSVHFLCHPLCCLLCENRRHGDAQIMLCFWEAPQPKR